MDGNPTSASRYGGFDVLRIAAALCVVLSHSFTLSGHFDQSPTTAIGRYVIELGNLGVGVFFVISGFLVTLSWERSFRASTFARNRFARIWPGITLVVLATVMVLGPAATSLSLGEYFSSGATYEYLWRNLTLVFGPVQELPGVFESNFELQVNAPLWTLPYEIWCYVALLLLAVSGVLSRRSAMIGLLTVCLLLFRFGAYGDQIRLPYAYIGVSMKLATELGSFFLLGVLVAAYRDRIRLEILPAVGLAAIAIARLVGEPTLYMIGLAFVVVGLGVSSNRFTRTISRFGDPSYGIYIMSFPIQQTLYATGAARTTWMMFLYSSTLSIALGYASWWFIERPALRRLKPQLGKAGRGMDQQGLERVEMDRVPES